MPEYIEREALIAEFKRLTLGENSLIERVFADGVYAVLETFPAADVVAVVRCGECERRCKSADLTDSVYCPWLKLQMRKNDFCSYGERRGEDG